MQKKIVYSFEIINNLNDKKIGYILDSSFFDLIEKVILNKESFSKIIYNFDPIKPHENFIFIKKIFENIQKTDFEDIIFEFALFESHDPKNPNNKFSYLKRRKFALDIFYTTLSEMDLEKYISSSFKFEIPKVLFDDKSIHLLDLNEDKSIYEVLNNQKYIESLKAGKEIMQTENVIDIIPEIISKNLLLKILVEDLKKNKPFDKIKNFVSLMNEEFNFTYTYEYFLAVEVLFKNNQKVRGFLKIDNPININKKIKNICYDLMLIRTCIDKEFRIFNVKKSKNYHFLTRDKKLIEVLNEFSKKNYKKGLKIDFGEKITEKEFILLKSIQSSKIKKVHEKIYYEKIFENLLKEYQDLIHIQK